MANGLPDVSPAGVSRIPDVSRGAGAAEEIVASMYADLGEKAVNLRRALTPAASEVARQRAYKDVTSGRFRGPRLVFSAEDAAYNESAESTWLARAHADVRATIGDAATTNPYDVEAFLEAADAARSAYKQRSPLAFGQSLDALFGQETTYQVDNITRAARARETELEAKDKQSNVDALWNRVTAYADAGDLSSSAFAAARDQWGAAFLAWAASPLSGLSEETARRAYDQHIDQLTLLAANQQALEVYGTEGPDAARAHAREIALDPDIDATPQMREALIAEVDQTIRQAETERRLEESELRSQVSRWESDFGVIYDPLTKAVSEGAPVSPLDIAVMREDAIALDAAREQAGEVPIHTARVDQLQELSLYRESITPLPPAALEAEILRLRAAVPIEGGAGLAAGRIAQAEAALSATGKMWEENPIGTAKALGVIAVPAINFADPATIVAAFTQRSAVADEIEDYAAIEAGLLEPAERAQLKAALSDPAATVYVAQALARGAPDRAAAELRAISGEGGDGVPLAYAGGFAALGGDPVVTTEIARGLALFRDDPEHDAAVSGQKAEEAAQRAFREATQAGETFAFSGEAAEGLYRASLARYELWAAGPGRGKEFDVGQFKEIVSQTAGRSEGGFGGFVDQRGRRITIPPRVSRQHWNDVVESLTTGDLLNAGGAIPVDMNDVGVTPEQMARLRWTNAGEPGTYYILDGEGVPLRAFIPGEEVPSYYVLDMNRIMPSLATRLGPARIRPGG